MEQPELGRPKITEKFIKNNYPEFYQYILDNYPEELTWSEKLYWYKHNLSSPGKCKVCGKNTKYVDFIKGYRIYCSSKCCNSDLEKKLQTKQSCLEKYGVENISQSQEIRNKVKQTCLEKYGVEHPFQSQEVQNKYKQTCLERYGTEHFTNRDKSKQTCLNRYNVSTPFALKETHKKSRKTCLEKYGGVGFASTELANKVKKTCLEKYGVEYASRSEEIRNKVKQTCLEKYGVENPIQSEEIRNKIKQICLERYGVEYPLQSREIQIKVNDTKHQNHTFNSSEIESDFASYLDSQNIEYIRQYRSKEYPFNCDFYLLKYDLYIEIQASWTHGGHPYDREADNDVLEKWKSKDTDYYKNAIETWTERDVKKRDLAKQSHLNYLEIFSNDIDEVIKCFENFIDRNYKTLIKNIWKSHNYNN